MMGVFLALRLHGNGWKTLQIPKMLKRESFEIQFKISLVVL